MKENFDQFISNLQEAYKLLEENRNDEAVKVLNRQVLPERPDRKPKSVEGQTPLDKSLEKLLKAKEYDEVLKIMNGMEFRGKC